MKVLEGVLENVLNELQKREVNLHKSLEKFRKEFLKGLPKEIIANCLNQRQILRKRWKNSWV